MRQIGMVFAASSDFKRCERGEVMGCDYLLAVSLPDLVRVRVVCRRL